MNRNIDLDAARAARAAAKQEQPTVTFGGKAWVLPAELPWAVAEAAAAQDTAGIVSAIASMLGEQWPEFKALNPSVEDMTALMEAVGDIYAAPLGK